MQFFTQSSNNKIRKYSFPFKKGPFSKFFMKLFWTSVHQLSIRTRKTRTWNTFLTNISQALFQLFRFSFCNYFNFSVNLFLGSCTNHRYCECIIYRISSGIRHRNVSLDFSIATKEQASEYFALSLLSSLINAAVVNTFVFSHSEILD